MSTLKLSGLNSGSSIIKAPDSGSTGVTFTLPASAGTLVTSADVTNKLPLAGGTMTGDLDISDTGAGALTVGGTTNAYSVPVLFTVSDIGLDVTDGTKHLASWASHGGSSHTGSAIGTRSNHDLALITNDTKRVVINTAGVVSIPQGIELGSGIDATAANTLDDYEEGTWTPFIHSSNSNRSGTWSNTVGIYTKIGNIVHLYFGITGSAMYFTSERGYQYITGIPFNAANPTYYNTYSGTWSGDGVNRSSAGHLYLNGSGLYMHSANSNPDAVGVNGIGCYIAYRTNS